MIIPSVIPTLNLHGHTMVRNGDLWVSRAPFTRGDWQVNAIRLRADHKKYGVLTETKVGSEVRFSLSYCSTKATLRDLFGGFMRMEDPDDGIYFGETPGVVAFEFSRLKGKPDRDFLEWPITGKTYFHAQAMCLAIGADLMTENQYANVVQGPSRERLYATPNGELFGPNGEEYVVSSLKTRRGNTVAVGDVSFPTDPMTGTRHYTGNVRKWVKKESGDWCDWYPRRSGSYWAMSPEDLTVENPQSLNFREYDDAGSDTGFLAAMPAKN